MKKGDIVVYSKNHYFWLIEAARWPNKSVPKSWNKKGHRAPLLRHDVKGEVIDSRKEGQQTVVIVSWDHAIYKDQSAVTSHFANNLDLQ